MTTQHTSDNIDMSKISFKFCSCCFKKYCPNPDCICSQSTCFFIPTVDTSMQCHYAYVHMSKDIIDAIYSIEEDFSFNLAEAGDILYVEEGVHPSPEREREIRTFFDAKLLSMDLTCRH